MCGQGYLPKENFKQREGKKWQNGFTYLKKAVRT